jgi:hypothetical protein
MPPDEFNIPARDLWKLFEDLRHDVTRLTVALTTVQGELEQTRTDMRAYNGLREQLRGMACRLDAIEDDKARTTGQAEGRRQVFSTAQVLLAAGLSVASLVLGIVLGH